MAWELIVLRKGDITELQGEWWQAGCLWVLSSTRSVAWWQIVMHGRHVFMGYLDEVEKTKEVLDSSGGLHSGDIGRKDENGFLYITGRIKGREFLTDVHWKRCLLYVAAHSKVAFSASHGESRVGNFSQTSIGKSFCFKVAVPSFASAALVAVELTFGQVVI